MLRSNKDIGLFSLGIAVCIFAVFYFTGNLLSGAIFGFLGGFFVAFYLLVKEHRRSFYVTVANRVIPRENVLFANKCDIYDGTLAVLGMAVITLSNVYCLARKKDNSYDIIHKIPIKNITNYEFNNIIRFQFNELTLEIKVKNATEFNKIIKEKIS